MDNEKVMSVVEDTKEQVLRELKALNAKKDVAPNEWENLDKAVSILEKCIHICHMEKENDYMDYKERSGMVRHVPMDTTMTDPYVHSGRRFANGRFVPMRGGRSGHSITDRMIDRLERMYDEAESDHEREVLGTWIDRIHMESGGV